ncbi:MAG: hydrogenase 3 maturation endopeptidase HyCI [Candidatus Omnitrophica bacterium]|nr:hydrogenase 3 maturation endopeptidase HyCI [Candidatus Omnitrophota bacterium]
MHKSVKDFLAEILKGKIILIGMGNTLRRDDGFGCRLIESIKDKVSSLCIDAGTAPENYFGVIAKENPDTVLFIDTMHMEKKPGDYDVFKKEDILRNGMTTHNISPAMLIEYLEKRTKADIYLMGVQPQNIFFGEELSARLSNTLRELSGIIINILGAKKNA